MLRNGGVARRVWHNSNIYKLPPLTSVNVPALDLRMALEGNMLRTPFSMLVAGPSQSGKTHFALRLINSAPLILTQTPTKVYFCYAELQPAYRNLPASTIMCQGLPPLDQLREDPDKHKLVIVDDLMMEASSSSELTALTTRGCHHFNCSLIFLVQNVFYKNQRTARLNMTYIVIFKSPGDNGQIRALAGQMYPTKPAILQEAYKDATSDRYGYLLMDLHQETPDRLRLRSKILPGDAGPIVYVPKNLTN